MKYCTLGNTGLEVSRIGFGVLTVGGTQLNLSVEESGELICYAMEQGINFFDTAQYYRTYPHIADALDRYDRLPGTRGKDAPIICSKCLDPTSRDMEEAIEEARTMMNRDVIDIFLLHEVRHDNDFALRQGAWEALQKAKSDGIVKAIGISTHHVDVAEEMLAVPECEVVFPLINKSSLGIRKGPGPGKAEEMASVISHLSSQGKGVFAMKVFGGGNLTGSYTDCLNYVNALDGVDSMMIGFGKKEEVDQAIAYIDGKLPDSFQPDVANKRIHVDAGDCEGCGACIARCPNGAMYRDADGLACVDESTCLTCGYCAPVCPVRAIIMY